MSDRNAIRSGDLITVFGGSGFVGRHVARVLCKSGYRVRIAVRRPFLAGDLRMAGEVGQIQLVQTNIRYRASVAAALEGARAAINLVGVLTPKGKQTFAATHIAGAENIAVVAADKKLARLIQISAIAADKDAPSTYLASKARGEAAARAAFPETIILRPSIVFGPEDDFFNRFAKMACLSPVLPLIGGGNTRLQPIHVSDLAAAIAAVTARADSSGQDYELGGAEIFSFRQLMELLLQQIDRRRLLLPIPFALAQALGQVLELLFALYPFAAPPLTVDQVEMLKQDNIARNNALGDLLDRPAIAVEDGIAEYLWRYRPEGQFHKMPA